MNQDEIQLAYSLLQYLRISASSRSVHKFNVIGRSGKGEFEQWLRRDLSGPEKQTLIWIWDEFKRLRVINATGTDLVNPDSWILVSERGMSITESDLEKMLRDDTQSKPQQKRLDGLLGIPDRAEFDKDFANCCGQADGNRPLSLVMIDLDHFKSINDDFGHPAGDEVLRQAADACSRASQGKGEVYRYGGEELAVLLPNHSLAEAAAVAERIRQAIEALDIAVVDRDVTASLGVAAFPEVTSEAKQVLQSADDALYRSKENGRNRVTCAEKSASDLPPKKRPKGRGVPTNAKLDVRVQLEQGLRESYLINVENHTDSKLLVEQISIEQNGIALMEPVKARAEDDWTVPPRLRRHINWRPKPNPAESLVHIHPNEGIQFNSTLDIVLAISANGDRYEHRQKIAVRVFATNAQLKQLAG